MDLMERGNSGYVRRLSWFLSEMRRQTYVPPPAPGGDREALAALRAYVAQVAKAGHGTHTANCATVPRELPRSPRSDDVEGFYEPQYTTPGRCSCGAMAVAAQVDAVLARSQ